MMDEQPLGSIYIGAVPTNSSERKVVANLHGRLTAARLPFVMLVNFELGGRQIDCVLVTARLVAVVEVKSSQVPVRGAMNGEWGMLAADGTWRRYTNGYRQVVDQKHLLADAIRSAGVGDAFQPDASVVFAHGLPLKSPLTSGNFKAEVTDLTAFDPLRAGRCRHPWSLDDWRRFALDLSLRPAPFAEVVEPAGIAACFETIRDHREAVEAELGRGPVTWLWDGEGQRDELVAAAEQRIGCYVEAPSGCGKTLVARWLGARFSRRGECVLFFAAKDFAGSWSMLLQREIGLLGGSPRSLFAAASATGTPLRIIFDGVNELGTHRESALRGLRTLARRYGACLLVTGQSAPPEELSALTRIRIDVPSIRLKERIAVEAIKGRGTGIRPLLEAVASGYEAAIVAEIGATAGVQLSRQLLVDQFIRKRLGAHARPVSHALRRFAAQLIETMRFSMSETAFDELLVGQPGATDIDQAISAGLLNRRAGRVSFRHEILLNACAAFGYAREAVRIGGAFAPTLARPGIAPLAIDILSAIEEPTLIKALLEASEDPDLVFEAADGLAGPEVRSVALGIVDATADAMQDEIVGLRLTISRREPVRVGWEPSSLRRWSSPEIARIEAFVRLMGTGCRVERHFALCEAMDARLRAECERIVDEASAAGIRDLRSDVFQLAYLGFWQETGFSRVGQCAAGGMMGASDPTSSFGALDMMDLSSGQLHFYLERRRWFHADVDKDAAAEVFARVLRERFDREPDDVKFAILHSVGFLRRAQRGKLETLVDALNAIDHRGQHGLIRSAIMDALRHIGGLADAAEEAREEIRKLFERGVGPVVDASVCELALTISTSMFDHPFAALYGEYFTELSMVDRHLLLRRAAFAERARSSLSLGWLLHELASFEDVADGAVMARFVGLPAPMTFFGQEEWSGFATATRFLGRHGLPLPPASACSDRERAVVGLRTVLHASESGDAGARASAWSALDVLPATEVIGCLADVERGLRQLYRQPDRDAGRLSLVERYPQQLLPFARRFFDEGRPATRHDGQIDVARASELAFSILEFAGDRTDLSRLRALSTGSAMAKRAFKAWRNLDQA